MADSALRRGGQQACWRKREEEGRGAGSAPRSLRSLGLSPSLRSRNVSSMASFQTVHPRFILVEGSPGRS